MGVRTGPLPIHAGRRTQAIQRRCDLDRPRRINVTMASFWSLISVIVTLARLAQSHWCLWARSDAPTEGPQLKKKKKKKQKQLKNLKIRSLKVQKSKSPKVQSQTVSQYSDLEMEISQTLRNGSSPLSGAHLFKSFQHFRMFTLFFHFVCLIGLGVYFFLLFSTWVFVQINPQVELHHDCCPAGSQPTGVHVWHTHLLPDRKYTQEMAQCHLKQQVRVILNAGHHKHQMHFI